MNFTTKEIPAKVIAIIDIGTYKVRASICKFQNGELDLIGYGEKRQESHELLMQDSKNLEGVCDNIALAIKKAEADYHISYNDNITVKDIIINIPFEEIFFESSKINHIRYNNENSIDKSELYKIIKDIEQLATKKQFLHIKESYGYDKEDLRLIISGITELRADDKKVKKLLGQSPEQISISLLNICIPEEKFEIIQYISRVLDKKIIRIIPNEFAITKLFSEKESIVIIDIGSTNTSIIIKKDYHILGVRKIAVGMESLIKQIKNNYNTTRIEIIKTIDSDLYQDEKSQFLALFKEILVISLEDILGKEICPNDFFMFGGGSNRFIKKYFQNCNLYEDNLKITGNIKFITPKMEYFDSIDSSKSNLNIYAMMLATLDFISKENDYMESILKKVIEDI